MNGFATFKSKARGSRLFAHALLCGRWATPWFHGCTGPRLRNFACRCIRIQEVARLGAPCKASASCERWVSTCQLLRWTSNPFGEHRLLSMRIWGLLPPPSFQITLPLFRLKYQNLMVCKTGAKKVSYHWNCKDNSCYGSNWGKNGLPSCRGQER